MTSNQTLMRRREAAVPRGVANACPIFVQRAENSELWDLDGKRYIDFASGIAVSDCLVGAVDGINEAGLAVSLNFGGARDVGDGFGAPLVLRYLLEFCSTVAEAAYALRRIPIHMAYNILLLDRQGDFRTAFTSPGAPTILRRTEASTNHQDRVAWPLHAEATATLDRERRLFEMLGNWTLTQETFVADFLRPPLFQNRYGRGYGTLYTAVYRPAAGRADYCWPNRNLAMSLADFREQTVTVELQDGSGLV